MNWTPEAIQEATDLYEVHNAHYIADHFGVTHEVMRKVFSDHGIEDPKLDTLHKDRRRAVKYRVQYRWSLWEIAQQLERSTKWVERTLRQAKREMYMGLRIVRRKAVQLSLFAPAQLELPLFNELKLAA